MALGSILILYYRMGLPHGECLNALTTSLVFYLTGTLAIEDSFVELWKSSQ